MRSSSGASFTPKLLLDANHTHVWKFDKSSGTTVANTGSGGTADAAIGSSCVWGKPGILGTSLFLPGGAGTDKCVVLPAGVYPAGTNWTVDMLVAVEDFTYQQFLWSKGTSVADLSVTTTRAITSFLTAGTVSTPAAIVVPTGLALITETLTTTARKVYLNGALVSSSAGSTQTWTGTGTAFNFGAFNGGVSGMVGRLEAAMFSNVARSLDEHRAQCLSLFGR